MKIIETKIFTKRVTEVLNEEEYRELQSRLILNPEIGQIIQGSGGIRKVRWTGSGRGKRGGSRILYYWISKRNTILMLLIYTKKEMDDLSKDQLKVLKTLVESELNG
ncbi:MAG: type II toxin-antitoxin system RelE/ParE family toxin [Calditrichaceae bacterium]|nr:type II toxin-antitoxin system RelE/ParE family toxin [Calditrichaceae bacterium]MBN2710494.1 type II toxin-antitoxin system RelE/ParE family toxin [Calditrichaceae bacterium]RQV97285.1 MAG: type II toxin-antitoxin system RelE/ParE family toxin [Calditrichota bacterium]